MVHEVYTKVGRPTGVPIIGMGGIQYTNDALEFLLAGACGLAIGTAMFVDPACIVTIKQGISDYLTRHGHKSVGEIVGAVEE